MLSLGLSCRELLQRFQHKLVILFKLMMLERRVSQSSCIVLLSLQLLEVPLCCILVSLFWCFFGEDINRFDFECLTVYGDSTYSFVANDQIRFVLFTIII